MEKPVGLAEEIFSPRLIIRKASPCYAAEVNEAVQESLPELVPWMPWARGHAGLKATEAHLTQACAAFEARNDLPLLIFLKDNSMFVGATGLHRLDWEVPKFEIGYWLRTSQVGKGLITEAVACLTEFAFSELKARRVEIKLSSRNDRSRRVAERAGYPLEAVLHHDRRELNGEVGDTLVFSKIV